MRPHVLELEAFMAFPNRVRLDWDDLSQGGLLLLCGDTGGGKTALLDALGFALYGVVPGERAKARDDLRSHHATPGARAWVRLEFTARGRRLRVTRRPAQDRPKARGAGTVTEQPTALLEQRAADGWRPVAQRLDEVGLEVGRLLGMDAGQFFQVVMLPQGRFAAFLHAEHREREKLLKQLFHVDRFERVETWLAERAAEAGRGLAQARGVLEAVAHRVAQAAGAPVPDLATPDRSWAPGLAEAAAQAAAGLEVEVRARADQRSAATRGLQQAERTAGRQQSRRQAEHELVAVECAQPAMAGLSAELAAAVRAAPVVVAARAAAIRTEQAERAELTEGRARAAVSLLGGDPDGTPGQLRSEAARLRTESGRLEGLRDVEERARVAERAAATAEVAALRLAQELTSGERRADVDLPRERTQAAQHLARAQQADREVPAARHQLERLGEQTDLAGQRAALVAERPVVEQQVQRAAAGAAQARRALQDVRTQRIDAAAAELAAALIDDTPCPVCGALEHPDVTEVRADHVSRDAERAAQQAADAAIAAGARAQGSLQVHDARIDDVTARLADLSGRAGDGPAAVDVSELSARQTAQQAGLAALECDAAELSAAVSTQAALQREAEGLGARLARLRAERDEADRTAATQESEAAGLRARVRAELGDVDLPSRQSAIAGLADALEQAADAGAAAASAALQAGDGQATAAQLAEQASLGGVAEALAAARTADWQVAAQDRLREHAQRRDGLRARLASDELAVALEEPAPVDLRRTELDRAETEHERALAQQQVAADRAAQLGDLVDGYAAACAVLPELARRAAQLQGLAELTAGRGSNRLSMPLSTFVLAARLEEVASAASLRLSRMSAGRYTMVHTDAGRDRRSRAGLGLQVEDGWTGRRRDTATLSGGETFMTALALALGLADVVTAEAGGQSIDALFVDEGFGTLDAGSLDQVMDVLDDLRSAGRLVGIVSHVAELRQRIPTQVRVVKSSSGSTVQTPKNAV